MLSGGGGRARETAPTEAPPVPGAACTRWRETCTRLLPTKTQTSPGTGKHVPRRHDAPPVLKPDAFTFPHGSGWKPSKHPLREMKFNSIWGFSLGARMRDRNLGLKTHQSSLLPASLFSLGSRICLLSTSEGWAPCRRAPLGGIPRQGPTRSLSAQEIPLRRPGGTSCGTSAPMALAACWTLDRNSTTEAQAPHQTTAEQRGTSYLGLEGGASAQGSPGSG